MMRGLAPSIGILISLLACGTSAPPGVVPIQDANVVDPDAATPDTHSSAGDAARGDAAEPPDTGDIADAGEPDSSEPDSGTPIVDLDQDGLDDAYEARIADEYLPFRAVHPDDACPLGAILFRVYPHPDAPSTRLEVIIDSIFERDCGANGHSGDDEVIAMTIDPARPAPAGILALRAIAHQNGPCEKVGECGPCAGLTACATALRRGEMFPVVYYSKNKHGSYTDEHECSISCFFTNTCAIPTAPAEPQLVNLGEPNHPLVRDLTAAGVVTSTNGWTLPELFGYDPWGGSNFGNGGGSIEGDMVDPAFITPACE